MVAIEERELLLQLRDNATREAAFARLVKLYQRMLYFHIRRMVIVHEDADDVLQNTLVKAWRNIDRFRAESALKTWLYRIATNEALTFLNRKKKASYTGVEDLEDDLRHSLRAGRHIEGEEIQMRLQEAILRLPERQRLVFNMRYFDEMKYDEMAEVLTLSTGALKASYHHAVKKIEKFLKEE
ncbi:MAG: sigma-70 family RNA polymerase sigma factor [Bacteroidota bacterium]